VDLYTRVNVARANGSGCRWLLAEWAGGGNSLPFKHGEHKGTQGGGEERFLVCPGKNGEKNNELEGLGRKEGYGEKRGSKGGRGRRRIGCGETFGAKKAGNP